MIPIRLRRGVLLGLLSVTSCLGLTVVPESLNCRPALSAETIYLTAGPLVFSLSIASLEKFATTGEIDRDLKTLARLAGPERMAEFRNLLNSPIPIELVPMSQLTYSPIGEDALERIGRFIEVHPEVNGKFGLRAALIFAAQKKGGFTLVDVLRQFPTPGIWLTARNFLQLQRELAVLMTYRTAASEAITRQADVEVAANPLPDSTKVPDLLKPGPYSFTRRQLELQRTQPAPDGTSVTLKYGVELIIPQKLSRPAPVVIISHGLGSSPAGFLYLAEHLASYGFAVALPEHVTSGAAIKEKFKAGILNTNVTPSSFLDRPLDVTQTLNELERLSQQDSTLAGKLDLQQVGILGHSFGGYTAFVSGGGKFNWEQVQTACQADRFYLNLSLFLQCVAQTLPKTDGHLADRRIKAIFSINPVTSAVVGQVGIEQIQVPTLVVASSADILASPVAEQVAPFLWLKTPEKYLVVAIPAGHTAPDTGGGPVDAMPSEDTLGQLLAGEDPPLMRQYMQMLSLAFMQVYVGDRPEYKELLSAAYARSISKEPLRLELIRSLTVEQIEQAYGAPLPALDSP